MVAMFQFAGTKTTTFNIGDLTNWDVSNVTNMSGMFGSAGKNATIWNIGNISNWNVSNVTDMANMFSYAGQNATYSLDLSTKQVTKEDGTTYTAWDVSNVTSYSGFNTGVESKITAPTWVN